MQGKKIIRHSGVKNIYRTRSLFLASLFNLLAPGLGYFYIGEFTFAIYFALLYPHLFIIVNYISVYLPQGINSFFFLLSYGILISFPVVHVIFQIIKNGKNKFYILKFRNKVSFYIIFLVAAFLYSSYLKDLTFELHYITTPSMENTLLLGDRILVRYNYYGIYESFSERRIFNFNSPEKNELVVYSTERNNRRVVYLKRIIVAPRDTLKIINKQVYINSVAENKNPNYKYDGGKNVKDYANNNLYPLGFGWNEDYYGPLYIPAKNDRIKIDSTNILVVKSIAKKEMKISGDAVEKEKYIDDIIKSGEYVVKNNYYFMMGDDRDNSLDSRYTGLVSEDEILGRAEFIIFNLNQWGRFGISLR